MQTLIDYLLRFGHLNAQQIELIQQKAAEATLKKGEYFSEAGKVARRVAFVTEGILRAFFCDNKGEEITLNFIAEAAFAVDLESFNYGSPATGYVEAVTDCSLIVFSRDAWKELSATIIGWDAIVSKVALKVYAEKATRAGHMLAEDAKTRYLHFLDNFPTLANRIPLSLLASFLGMTQSSLSRIRKGISG